MDFKKRLKTSVAMRTTFLVLLMIAIILMVFAFWQSHQVRTVVVSEVQRQASRSMDNAIGTISDRLSDVETALETTAGYADVFAKDEQSCYQLIERLITHNNDIAAVTLLYRNEFFPKQGRYYAPTVYRDYESKKIFGGVLHEFNMESYSRDEFMKRQVKKFYEIIENNDIYYEFQPIVSLLDGNVFGYEAFMRTNDTGIFSAEKMLEIAESENMGYAIEKMTVFNCARMIKENRDIFKDKKLFYNTIINRSLTDMDMQEYNDEYSSIGYLMIPEIRASDNEGEVFEKCMQLMKGDGRKAIDHFMGKYLDYNRLTAAGIHYFKLDRNIIADIFVKKERQALVNTVVKEVKKHNAITIAVGVESREELRVLVELGVDFAQGYYISVPKKNFTKDIRTEIKNEILEFNQLRKFTD